MKCFNNLVNVFINDLFQLKLSYLKAHTILKL